MNATRTRGAMLHGWRDHVVAGVDHAAVLAQVRDDSGWSGRYAFMILMASAIAVLGILLPSPVVVIGAMLISPLMGPIIGLGFGLATFDTREIKRSVVALAIGAVLAVLFSALIVAVSPIQNVTGEVASRTQPNLFDLGIALFSALAGTYATIRGRAGAVIGVALATALLPPLAVVGFGLATGNRSVATGAALLFFTNFTTIALSAAVVARLYRFGPRLSPQQTLVQTLVLLAILVALAVPLGLTLRQVAQEAVASREARDVIGAAFDDSARVAQIDLDYQSSPIRVVATVFTPRYVPDAERTVTAQLQRLLNTSVAVSLEQIHVEAGEADAQAGQTGGVPATATREANVVATRVALIAGVTAERVLVDRSARHVAVRATVLPGAALATYRELEQRVAAASAGWRIMLTPPLLPLPPVAAEDGAPDPAALRTIAWAAARLAVPVEIAGTGAAADRIAAALTEAGVTVTRAPGRRERIAAAWAMPAQEEMQER